YGSINQPAIQPRTSATTLCTIRSRSSSMCSTNVARNSSGSSEEFRLTFHQGVFAMARDYLLFKNERVFPGDANELGRGRGALAARTLPTETGNSLAARPTDPHRTAAAALLKFGSRRRRKHVVTAGAGTT